MTQTKFRDKLGTTICVGDKIVKARGYHDSSLTFYEVVGETAQSLRMRCHRNRGTKPLAYRDFSSMLIVKDSRVGELFKQT